MTVNPRPVKRIKFRVRADLCNFYTFASTPDQPYTGPFRINVRQFLSRHARLVAASDLDGMMTWQMNFRVSSPRRATSEPSNLTLEVVEEDVARCQKIYCDHCRVVGWGRHPVCAKRYHFIIRNSNSQFKFRPRLCTYCGSTLDLSESRCFSCNGKIDVNSMQEPEYSRIDDTSHLLHGIVHSNGYGHLVRINGLEGGSQIVNGCDIMDFWDRLCRLLRVRKITVMDISKKHDMEYRLLHAIIHGHPWYGNWGYEFGTGSFGLMYEAYGEALQSLSTEPLSLIFSNCRSPRSQLQNTIAFYQFLSDNPLVTVRDLFSFLSRMLGWQTPKSKAISIVQEQAFVEPCTWSAEDVMSSFDKILKVLNAAAQQWVSWQNLKGATSRSVGSMELLSYCLKHLNGKTNDDGRVVAVRRNKETGSIEYRLEAAGKNCHGSQVAQTYKLRKVHIQNDLRYLYNALLNPQTMHGYKPLSRLDSARLSATKLLNSKHLIKHYDKADDFSISNPFLIQITCNIEAVDLYKDSICPPEILTLPVTATVSDLKAEAAKAFKETYLIHQNFEADQLLDCKVASETTQVKLLFGSRGNAFINGRCYGGRRRLGIYRMERGVEKWMVDCVCGAKDDDGERMLACDVCGVWQHTRCSNIKDAENVPEKFVCRKCNNA
ncbi:hypothetical protein LUZ61_007605 [Rhynchospora tenuis]|uniref:Zinc finger PHD-type domain-containing protein n=1 Tax=Rhynchospora tenuis TaxID=198213 RepID=A0AAD6EWS3_9POAL|nr:hypothetical protein LUZ61_007605 [Rhynchospora tenuis]